MDTPDVAAETFAASVVIPIAAASIAAVQRFNIFLIFICITIVWNNSAIVVTYAVIVCYVRISTRIVVCIMRIVCLACLLYTSRCV